MLVLLAATLAWQGPVGATVVLPSPPLAAGAQAPAEADPATRGEGVLVDSAAVRDVFDPLPGVSAAGGAYWQAALATLPDPVESRLARSFDIEVATLVRSFQFSGYVLQGHAMPWPVATEKSDGPPPRPFRSTPAIAAAGPRSVLVAHDASASSPTSRTVSVSVAVAVATGDSSCRTK